MSVTLISTGAGDGGATVLHLFGGACLSVLKRSQVRHRLWGQEASALVDAPRARVLEFGAGRAAARAALLGLGLPSCPVPQGTGGEPIWPNGICGSISHTDRYAVALVAPTAAYSGVGVDVDDERPVGSRAARQVTWARETKWLIAWGLCANEAAAHNLAFSAKEAIFKCQYPLTRQRHLHFQQVRLVEPELGSEAPIAVSGWRVTPTIAGVLRRIVVWPLEIAGQRIAVAGHIPIVRMDSVV
jgi:4'-phosphopantetheinyl transferase EntD